jgi:hypothetical protein
VAAVFLIFCLFLIPAIFFGFHPGRSPDSFLPTTPIESAAIKKPAVAGCKKNPQAEAWGYTDEARLRGLKQKNPQAKAWGYTDKARLRGLHKNLLPIGLGIRSI